MTLADYGIVGIILTALAAALWRIITFLGHRLFDPKQGIVVLAVKKHIELVQHIQATTREQTESTKETTEAIRQVQETIADLHKRINGTSHS